MSSGRQLAEQNVRAFAAWVASKTDYDFAAMANRGVLPRGEIAKDCGFAKSALDQNPRIKAALRELEDGLRRRGILPPATERNREVLKVALMRESSNLPEAREAAYLQRLEQENAALKIEVAELRRVVERYAVLRDALDHTGRVPR